MSTADPGITGQSVVADYTEAVVPPGARRSNFRMFLTFSSMQLVFGAVLVGYDARFQGLSLSRLTVAMAIAAATMTVYCIGSANVGAVSGRLTPSPPGASSAPSAARWSRCCSSSTAWGSTSSPCSS